MQSVQVIIERLKSHPEDFFGEVDDNLTLKTVYPKFHRYVKPLDELTAGKSEQPPQLWYLEPEERAALIAAYKEALRVRFEAKVFHVLLTTPEEERNTVTMKTHGRYVGTGANNAVPHTLGWEPEMVWVKAPIKREGEPI